MTTPVSYKLANLLKEKGFDESTSHIYPIKTFIDYSEDYGKEFKEGVCYEYCFLDKTPIINAPTIAQAVMWLYEKHMIWVSVSCDCGNDNLFYSKIFSTNNGLERCIWTIKDKSNPTIAYESGIKYTLENLI